MTFYYCKNNSHYPVSWEKKSHITVCEGSTLSFLGKKYSSSLWDLSSKESWKPLEAISMILQKPQVSEQRWRNEKLYLSSLQPEPREALSIYSRNWVNV